jgi:hypothetical protein
MWICVYFVEKYLGGDRGEIDTLLYIAMWSDNDGVLRCAGVFWVPNWRLTLTSAKSSGLPNRDAKTD